MIPIGVCLRKIRLTNGDILKTMAEKLGVSSAFLSAVENGKKKMPTSWQQKLTQLYNLDADQQNALAQAVLESGNTVELKLHNTKPEQRNLAITFARCFDDLDEETSRHILNILEKSEEN